MLTLVDRVRGLGAAPIALPESVARAPATLVAALPLPPPRQWIQAATHPLIVDTTRAKTRLGWRPRFTGLEAWRDTLRPPRARGGLSGAQPARALTAPANTGGSSREAGTSARRARTGRVPTSRAVVSQR